MFTFLLGAHRSIAVPGFPLYLALNRARMPRQSLARVVAKAFSKSKCFILWGYCSLETTPDRFQKPVRCSITIGLTPGILEMQKPANESQRVSNCFRGRVIYPVFILLLNIFVFP